MFLFVDAGELDDLEKGKRKGREESSQQSEMFGHAHGMGATQLVVIPEHDRTTASGKTVRVATHFSHRAKAEEPPPKAPAPAKAPKEEGDDKSISISPALWSWWHDYEVEPYDGEEPNHDRHDAFIAAMGDAMHTGKLALNDKVESYLRDETGPIHMHKDILDSRIEAEPDKQERAKLARLRFELTELGNKFPEEKVRPAAPAKPSKPKEGEPVTVQAPTKGTEHRIPPPPAESGPGARGTLRGVPAPRSIPDAVHHAAKLAVDATVRNREAQADYKGETSSKKKPEKLLVWKTAERAAILAHQTFSEIARSAGLSADEMSALIEPPPAKPPEKDSSTAGKATAPAKASAKPPEASSTPGKDWRTASRQERKAMIGKPPERHPDDHSDAWARIDGAYHDFQYGMEQEMKDALDNFDYMQPHNALYREYREKFGALVGYPINAGRKEEPTKPKTKATPPAKPATPAPAPAPASSSTSTSSGDFSSKFEAAFQQHRRASGSSDNLISLDKLRAEFPDMSKEQFDTELNKLRRSRRFVLEGADGRHKRPTDSQRAASIEEGKSRYFYVSRNDTEEEAAAEEKHRAETIAARAHPKADPYDASKFSSEGPKSDGKGQTHPNSLRGKTVAKIRQANEDLKRVIYDESTPARRRRELAHLVVSEDTLTHSRYMVTDLERMHADQRAALKGA